MVKISLTNNFNDEIIKLWKEAFGDSIEDIRFFIDNCKNMSCLTLHNDGELCSMLFLVDAVALNKKYKYIYAACTFEKYKKLGYMSRLLEFSQNDIGNLLLIPADDKLVDFYSKRGFNHKIDINGIIFNECDEIKDYLFEGCRLKEPFALAFMGE